MGDAATVTNIKTGSLFPLWWLIWGMAVGFFSGLGFVSWWFGPEDFTHSMALIHEGAGTILGGLLGAVTGLTFKLKKHKS